MFSINFPGNFRVQKTRPISGEKVKGVKFFQEFFSKCKFLNIYRYETINFNSINISKWCSVRTI